jgi:hypothetical protein
MFDALPLGSPESAVQGAEVIPPSPHFEPMPPPIGGALFLNLVLCVPFQRF